MIFATVGTQLPFDRLLTALESWASDNAWCPVVAQTGVSKGAFDHLRCEPFISQDEFRTLAEKAEVIVSHAGMGTILTAAELGKPVVVMPRRAALGEHRNDHQLATLEEMRNLPNVIACEDEQCLAAAIDEALKSRDLNASSERISNRASDELLDAVASFINGPRRGF